MTREHYTTDMTDGQWKRGEALLPVGQGGRIGRPRKYSQREVLNAIFYLLRSGRARRLLPHDFPPYNAVWAQFRRWRNDGTLDKIHEALRVQARRKAGRQEAPSAAILDSQSVKTTEKGVPKASTRPRK